MSAEDRNTGQSKQIEVIEMYLEKMWGVLSVDEKMTNEKLSKRYKVLRQLLATLRDLNRCNLPKANAN